MPVATMKSIRDKNEAAEEIASSGGQGGAPGERIDGEQLGTSFEGIYHEKQIGSLCAVHCVNNLVQTRLCDEVKLGEIAMKLDRDERAALGGASLEGESANVRADGFFSVQVISQALQNAGLSCTPIGAEEVRDAQTNPQNEIAFICNRSQHWLAIRKLGNYWFDLNSMRKKPTLISELYLQLYMEQVKNTGYSIFVVRGNFPAAAIELEPAKLKAAAEKCKRDDSSGVSASGSSKEEAKDSYSAFSGHGQTLAAPAPAPALDADLMAAAAADPELAAAIAASLSEQQHQPPAKRQMTDAERRAEMRAKRLAALDRK